jgi:membrane-bound acyltransferase YfiQ involved in biofilm formation
MGFFSVRRIICSILLLPHFMRCVFAIDENVLVFGKKPYLCSRKKCVFTQKFRVKTWK